MECPRDAGGDERRVRMTDVEKEAATKALRAIDMHLMALLDQVEALRPVFSASTKDDPVEEKLDFLCGTLVEAMGYRDELHGTFDPGWAAETFGAEWLDGQDVPPTEARMPGSLLRPIYETFMAMQQAAGHA